MTNPSQINDLSCDLMPLPSVVKTGNQISNNLIGIYNSGKIHYTAKTYIIDSSKSENSINVKNFNDPGKFGDYKNIYITQIIRGKVDVYSGKDQLIYREKGSSGLDNKIKKVVNVLYVRKGNEPMVMMNISALKTILADNSEIMIQLALLEKEKIHRLNAQELIKIVCSYNTACATTSNNVALILNDH